MNKLGFAIKLANKGAGNVIECNKGSWVNKVVDIREYLNLFNGLQGTDNIVTFISFDEGGCFLTQLRAISGRVGDFLSGWIYIPSVIDISDEEVINAYNYVKNILSQSSMNKTEINQFFDKEYMQKSIATAYTPSHGDKFGVRFFGMYSLKEIIGTNRYQPIYSNYKAVFLMDQKDEVKIAPDQGRRFENLTNQRIDTLCYLLPPTFADLQKLGGVKVLREDGSEFTSAMLARKGETKTFQIVKKGFDKQTIQIPVQSESQPFPVQNLNLTWEKLINRSMFNFITQSGHEIDSRVNISINGKELGGKTYSMTEAECAQAEVAVTSNDFEDYKRVLNLLHGPITIQLTRKKKSSTYRIEMANGSVADVTLQSKFMSHDSYESPLEGYDFDSDEPGLLRISSWYKWKQRLFGFFGAVVLGLLVTGCILLCMWFEKTGPFAEDTTPQEETPQEQTEVESEYSHEDSIAIDYLNKNDTWAKTELEKYELTRGLYDKINNYEFNKLIAIDIPCDKIKQIVEVSNQAVEKKIPSSPAYSNDGTITPSNWISKVTGMLNGEITNGSAGGSAGSPAGGSRSGGSASGSAGGSRSGGSASGSAGGSRSGGSASGSAGGSRSGGSASSSAGGAADVNKSSEL